MNPTGSIFRHLFPIDGPSLIEGRALSYLFGLVIPVQRSVKHHRDIEVRWSDYVLCLNLDFPATFDLPMAHRRRGKPIRFVDAANKVAKHPVTLRPFGHERIVNWPHRDLVMTADGEIVTLWPFWDQQHHGWFVYPEPQGTGSTTVSDQPPRRPAVGVTWWDTVSKQMFVWDGRQWVAATCCDEGIHVSDDPPDRPGIGWLWWDSDSKQMFVWSGQEWVAASCCDEGIHVSARPPDRPQPGWQWWDTVSGQLFIYTGSEWVTASCCAGGGGATTSEAPPSKPFTGQLWWDPGGGQLYLWYQGSWVPASC